MSVDFSFLTTCQVDGGPHNTNVSVRALHSAMPGSNHNPPEIFEHRKECWLDKWAIMEPNKQETYQSDNLKKHFLTHKGQVLTCSAV